jgi:hypothetical protein
MESTLIACARRPFGLEFLQAQASDPIASFSTRILAVATTLWAGRVSSVDPANVAGTHVSHVIARLAIAALAGPPWATVPNDLPIGASNDAAMVCYLAGRRDDGDALLRKRHRYLAASGATHERFNWYYPGPLAMALGPPEVAPNLDWLMSEILEPAYPNLWAVHRGLCALVLAERGNERARELTFAGLSILERVQPDQAVKRWIAERLEAASA